MANGVRIVCDEWNSVQESIRLRTKEITDTLDEFQKIISTLSTNGFIEGSANKAIVDFKSNVAEIKECVFYISNNIINNIVNFTDEVEKMDHNRY